MVRKGAQAAVVGETLYLCDSRRATTVADRLGVDFALINRNRHKGDRPDAEGHMELLVGDVKDKVSPKKPFSTPRTDS